ncbi:MAG: outer membrane beta-barrel protein [Lentisphaerae bacterium]|nr:outer membrane beta-barrel protein [Lentisphaerota bacterium]
MKKAVLVLVTCWISVPALAQFAGLPIAGPATVGEGGATWVSAGAVIGDDFNLYGGRLSFSPIGRLSLFADAGAIDPDDGDLGLSFQGGVQFTLPMKESPVDVAARATWGHAGFDVKGGDVKMSGFNIGALLSRDLESFSPYVFLGLNVVDSEVKAGGAKHTDDATDLAAAFGALLRLGHQFALYGEIAHVDDLFFSVGLRRVF